MSHIYIKNINLIDGTGKEIQNNVNILIKNGKINDITKNNIKLDNDVEIIDYSDKIIMPGLIDAHVHTFLEPIADPVGLIMSSSPAKTILRAANNLKKHLQSGVTFIRDLGGVNYYDIQLKECLKEGLIGGPGVLVSGHLITMTGGHGYAFGKEADGVDEVRKAARQQLKAGADVIKIMATGGVMTPGVEPGSPQLNKEEIEAAVFEAHKAGKRAASHAQGTQGIKNAILAGVDSIEHGIFLDDEAIELMLERGTFLVPTLVAPYYIVEVGVEGGIPPFAVEKSKRVIEHHVNSFGKAYKAGVKIAMGTDAGTPFNLHGKSANELKLMVEYGMNPMDTIVAATKISSELLNIDKEYGTLEIGKYADFMILNNNPLENMDTILSPLAVYKNGKRV